MNSGDGFVLRLDIDVRSSTTDNYGVFLLDIGGSQGEIQNRTFSMPSDLWLKESKTFGIYTLGTFKSNGGLIGVRALNQAFYIGAYSLTVFRVHDASIQ